jgi:DNA polymerase III sliding clamp (beta) subunit (PCNA family)
MRANRKSIIEALSAVKPGLANSELIEQSKSFIFRGGNVFTYNDEVAISHPISLDIEGAIPSAELFALLSKTKDDDLGFELVDEVLKITGKKFDVEIRCDTKITLPIINVKPEVWFPLPKNFLQAVKESLFTIGKDVTKPILTCLNIHNSIIESCDNYRLTRYHLSGEILHSIFLPGRSARQLLPYTAVSYSMEEGWIHFLVEGGIIFSCRVFNGVYPDLTDLLEMKTNGTIHFPPDMEGILDRAQAIRIDDSGIEQNVKVKVHDGKLTVSTLGKSGKFTESTRMRDKENSVAFSINIDFLKQILGEVREAELSEDGRKIKFTCSNFIHIIALAGE